MHVITRRDAHHEALQKGFNLRWPPSTARGADEIRICTTPEEVQAAANAALAAGHRITVRSGGHCYEGLVSNKLADEWLTIIDLGEMKGMQYDEGRGIHSLCSDAEDGYRFRILTGNQNWDGYISLYKQAGRTLPGGSCYSVGVGGHISGGGYGLLSRLHGLTVDWVTGVDVLVPNPDGTALVPWHVRADSKSAVQRDLFTACCGAGGGNFGIITAYYFDQLPEAPRKAYWLPLAYPWASLKSRFTGFLQSYWRWFEQNDADATNPAKGRGNGGLFTVLKLNHIDASDNVVLGIHYTGPQGDVGGENDLPLMDFIRTMNDAAGVPARLCEDFILPNIPPVVRAGPQGRAVLGVEAGDAIDWICLTQTVNGSGANQRGKYKSVYQNQQFTPDMCDELMRHLMKATADRRFRQTLVQIDSYGGALNRNGLGMTAVPQRASLLKTQFQTYWSDSAEDALHLAWMREIYTAVHQGKPSRPVFDGCYINYPDIDMRYDESGVEDPDWLNIYYGWNTELIEKLIALKGKVDPTNIFRHALSIPLVPPQ
ncbi:MAG: FAD-binding oxidoreductase [Stenotrophomonas sp.]|nr:FAD-binding oxidoreductase [Stenotrophomonas sp.]